MSSIEESLRSLLEERKRQRDSSIAEMVEKYGYVPNPFNLRPRSISKLPLPFPSGIGDRKLDDFEHRRGIRLPRSLREWLQITNGATGFYGIRPKRLHSALEREMDFWSDWKQRGWIPVASDDFGNRFVQFVDNDPDGVEPVCYVEVIGNYISYVAASNMMTFALLKLEDELQLHEKYVERAGLVQYYPKRRLAKGAPRTPVDWQFNKRYMLFRDPELTKIKGLPLPWSRTLLSSGNV